MFLFVQSISATYSMSTVSGNRVGHDATGAVQAGLAVSLEAARVPEVYGSGDPGDCYIIASARIGGHAVVTRDAQMRSLSRRLPGYLSVVGC